MTEAEGTWEQQADAPGQTAHAYAAAFTGDITPSKVSFFYQAGLAVVAFAMILLPTVYLGVVCLTGYGVYYHAVHDTGILSGRGGGLGRVLLYFGPLFMGGILVVFMVKPFFARKPGSRETFSVSHTDQPQLFAFIGRICQLVNAPLPSRIDVDCQVNASAGFRKGFASMFSNDVVLTIGLPLVAGLNMRQFAGVMAHEFGHFAQGTGMRLSYIIYSINSWFARVVYERDEWDIYLKHAASSVDIRIGIILHGARFAVWLTRRILWVLMYLGHAFSCFMSRQMEYDADSYETRVAGSATFRETSWRMQVLNAASEGAYEQLGESWKNKRLADDLPDLIQHQSGLMPELLRNELARGFTERKTKLFDTHPANADRIRAAELLNEPGVFAVEEPAANLFHDFPALSKAVTRFHYQNNLGLVLTDANLVGNQELVQEGQANAKSAQATNDYLPGIDLIANPLLLKEEEVIGRIEAATALANLAQARDVLAAQRETAAKASKELEEADGKILTGGVLLYLFRAGFQVKPADFGIRESNEGAARQLSLEAEARRRLAMGQLAATQAAAHQRVTAAMQLLRHPETAPGIPDAAALQAEAESLLKVIYCLDDLLERFKEIRLKHASFVTLLQHRDPNNDMSRLDQQLERLAPELSRLVSANLAHTQRITYPFVHARGQLTVSDYARFEGGAMHPWETAMRESGTHIDRMYSLYQRAFGRLVVIAAQVEAAVLLQESSPAINETTTV